MVAETKRGGESTNYLDCNFSFIYYDIFSSLIQFFSMKNNALRVFIYCDLYICSVYIFSSVEYNFKIREINVNIEFKKRKLSL